MKTRPNCCSPSRTSLSVLLIAIPLSACNGATPDVATGTGGTASESRGGNAATGGSSLGGAMSPGAGGAWTLAGSTGNARGGASLGGGGTATEPNGGANTLGGAGSAGTPSRGGVSATATGGNATGGKSTGGTTAGGKATGGSATAGAGSAESNGGGTSGAPTSGCGKVKPAQAPAAVDAAGTDRTFLVDLPSSYDANTPTPILFAFHGMYLTATQFRQIDNLTSAFGSGYIIVRPNALGDPTEWESTGTKDFVFFDAMLKLLSETYCIDAKRVFLTGHSSGGYFTNALGCQRSAVVRAIAPQSGAGPLQPSKCTGAVATMIIHGQKDTGVVPAEGVKSRDYWGKAAGCDMTSGTTSSLNAVCIEYAGCELEHPLVYCPYDGDHNLWKDAPKAMLDFFSRL